MFELLLELGIFEVWLLTMDHLCCSLSEKKGMGSSDKGC